MAKARLRYVSAILPTGIAKTIVNKAYTILIVAAMLNFVLIVPGGLLRTKVWHSESGPPLGDVGWAFCSYFFGSLVPILAGIIAWWRKGRGDSRPHRTIAFLTYFFAVLWSVLTVWLITDSVFFTDYPRPPSSPREEADVDIPSGGKAPKEEPGEWEGRLSNNVVDIGTYTTFLLAIVLCSDIINVAVENKQKKEASSTEK